MGWCWTRTRSSDVSWTRRRKNQRKIVVFIHTRKTRWPDPSCICSIYPRWERTQYMNTISSKLKVEPKMYDFFPTPIGPFPISELASGLDISERANSYVKVWRLWARIIHKAAVFFRWKKCSMNYSIIWSRDLLRKSHRRDKISGSSFRRLWLPWIAPSGTFPLNFAINEGVGRVTLQWDNFEQKNKDQVHPNRSICPWA